MELLDDLHAIIKRLEQENLDGLNFHERSEKLRPHNEKYNELIEKWINACQSEQLIPFDEIKKSIDTEIDKVRSSFTWRPNPKLPNRYDLLLIWSRRLYYLKYEIEKKGYSGENIHCYCDLRISNRIEPDFTALSDYGRAVLYYEDDDYLIGKCNYCGTKWVKDDSPGSTRGWHKWDPNEFLLREVFENN